MADNLTFKKITIKRFKIMKLFGKFNYNLNLERSEGVTILHGLNGTGKTTILEILFYISQSNFPRIASYYFDEINIFFNVITSPNENEEIEARLEIISKNISLDVESRRSDLEIKLYLKENQIGKESIKNGRLTYLNLSDPEVFSIIERSLRKEGRKDLYRYYDYVRFEKSESLPIKITEEIFNFLRGQKDIWFKISKKTGLIYPFLSELHTHFITASRLIKKQEPSDDEDHIVVVQGRKLKNDDEVVNLKSNDLVDKIQKTLKRFYEKSQNLDKQFPSTIFEIKVDRNNEAVLEDERKKILDSLKQIQNKRDNYIESGILPSEEATKPFSEKKELTKTFLQILQIYINNNEDKFEILKNIYEKVILFKQLMTDHFSRIELSINSEKGIIIKDRKTNTNISLEKLSSGEKNLLIMFYELIFECNDDEYILLDEPEISLHVGWQNTLINDFLQIRAKKDIRFIIATHSPEIANRDDLCEPLDEVD